MVSTRNMSLSDDEKLEELYNLNASLYFNDRCPINFAESYYLR